MKNSGGVGIRSQYSFNSNFIAHHHKYLAFDFSTDRVTNSFKILSILTLMVFAALLIFGFEGDQVDATSFSEGHYTFTIIDGDGVRIDSYDLDTGQLIIPDSIVYESHLYYIKEIGTSAFYNHSNLYGEIVLPHKLEIISGGAFQFCKGLYGPLNIPDTVRYIGDHAFTECSGFTSLDLPKTLEYLGQAAFSGCSGLVGDLNIPTGISTIPTYAFMGCKGFSGALTIPAGVTTIDSMAFRFAYFDSVVFPSTLKTIGPDAFSSARIYNGSITIPGSVESIGSQAFYYVDFNSLIIQNGVKSIGTECFAPLLSSPSYISLPSSLTSMSPNSFPTITFYSEDGVELDKTIAQLAGHYFAEVDGKLIRDAVVHTVILDSSPISSCKLTGSGTYLSGSVVDISVTPNSGYIFREWSDGVKDQTRSIVVDKDIELTAICDEAVTLSLSCSPYGSGSVKGAGTYAKGSTVEISVTPYSPNVFKEWSDGVKDQTRSIVVDKSMTLTAYCYPVHSVYFDVKGGSQQMPTQTVPEGEQFFVPDYSGVKDGYHFSCWSYDGIEWHSGDSFFMGDHDIYFVAVWESEKSGSDDYTLFLIIGAVAAVIVGIAVVVLMKRRV